jgi:hypothetical protein
MSVTARPLRLVARGARDAALVAALVATTGCLEFADPTIPNRAAPAVLQANMRVFDQGVFQVDGSLQPGRDSAGFQRSVQSPFIHAAGHLIEPLSLGSGGRRSYMTAMTIPPRETLGPFELIAPVIRGVDELPTVVWHGLARLDPDTIVVRPGEDIVLRMDTADAMPQPANPNRQWFLDVSAGPASFRLSSNGVPPLTLRIPADWIPPPENGHALVSLVYLQSRQLRTPDGLYIGNILLDVRLRWVVRFETDP